MKYILHLLEKDEVVNVFALLQTNHFTTIIAQPPIKILQSIRGLMARFLKSGLYCKLKREQILTSSGLGTPAPDTPDPAYANKMGETNIHH